MVALAEEVIWAQIDLFTVKVAGGSLTFGEVLGEDIDRYYFFNILY